MRTFTFFVLMIIAFSTAFAGKPPSGCGDVPISYIFEDPVSAPAAMWNDIPGMLYQNGVINYEGSCDGTRDATIGTDSGRFLWMQFPAPAAIVEGGPPSFAGGPAFMTQTFINVRNITARNTGLQIPGPPAVFYTKFSGNFEAPDGNHYRFGSMPPNASCPLGAVCAPNLHLEYPATVNQPEQSGWVKVTYTRSPGIRLLSKESSFEIRIPSFKGQPFFLSPKRRRGSNMGSTHFPFESELLH